MSPCPLVFLTAEAEEALQQALLRLRRAGKEQDRQYAWTLNSLAAIRSARGDHAEAVALYKESLEIRRIVFGPRRCGRPSWP